MMWTSWWLNGLLRAKSDYFFCGRGEYLLVERCIYSGMDVDGVTAASIYLQP